MLAVSRLGGAQNMRRYSRLNCEGLPWTFVIAAVRAVSQAPRKQPKASEPALSAALLVHQRDDQVVEDQLRRCGHSPRDGSRLSILANARLGNHRHGTVSNHCS